MQTMHKHWNSKIARAHPGGLILSWRHGFRTPRYRATTQQRIHRAKIVSFSSYTRLGAKPSIRAWLSPVKHSNTDFTSGMKSLQKGEPSWRISILSKNKSGHKRRYRNRFFSGSGFFDLIQDLQLKIYWMLGSSHIHRWIISIHNCDKSTGSYKKYLDCFVTTTRMITTISINKYFYFCEFWTTRALFPFHSLILVVAVDGHEQYHNQHYRPDLLQDTPHVRGAGKLCYVVRFRTDAR